MFIINPDLFLVPSYRISPFTSSHIAINNELPNDNFAVGYFDKKFGEGNWNYTFNGREAIELALQYYNLNKNDLVTIVTTSENFYISSCVTKSIEKYCRWNRELLPETKIIFVNHEFGFPYLEIEKLLTTGIPIIEDCCTTFFSQDEKQNVGHYGNFSVYSFPKFFPLQIGGLLVSNTKKKTTPSTLLDKNQKQYIQNVISNDLKNESNLLYKRNQNFDYLLEQFLKLGFTPRFQTNQNIFPSALLLNNNSIINDLNKLKTFLIQNGIQSSIFYGEDAFFIPCHQNLSINDLDYFTEVLKAIIN
ncbi:DegT/DnrJ/EryC1/StrS family aminotransferase [Flavobacterium sp.]|uniref:DegT/DnrJ/EryC1/StrS family aminotransferase n=1 Tax=Flavobacterium sp. TaxID=239 RepID=UPI0025E9D432|nr:DegT/DnrJ/EryC1/StrS family aminotransferase [Flavobacterium sp.]